MIFTKPIDKLKEIKSNLPDIGGIINDGKNPLLDNFKELEQETIAKFTNDLKLRIKMWRRINHARAYYPRRVIGANKKRSK